MLKGTETSSTTHSLQCVYKMETLLTVCNIKCSHCAQKYQVFVAFKDLSWKMYSAVTRLSSECFIEI